MVTLYYTQDKRYDFPHIAEPLFYNDKNKLEEMMRGLSNGFVTMSENDNYEIRSFEISDKCKCDNYMQTAMVLLDMRDPEDIRLVATDNYLGIHNKTVYRFDVDFESQSEGLFQLMTIDYFHEHFELKQKEAR